MNFYEMLRRIVAKGTFTETEYRDFMALIEYLEGMNAFGTVSMTVIQSHEHRAQWDTVMRKWSCMDCGIPIAGKAPPTDHRGKKLDAWGRYVSE